MFIFLEQAWDESISWAYIHNCSPQQGLLAIQLPWHGYRVTDFAFLGLAIQTGDLIMPIPVTVMQAHGSQTSFPIWLNPSSQRTPPHLPSPAHPVHYQPHHVYSQGPPLLGPVSSVSLSVG